MRSQRDALVFVLGLAAASAALAQSDHGSLRWRSGGTALGLQPGVATPALQCGPFSMACDSSAALRLYESPVSPRSVTMQVGFADAGTVKMPRPQGLSLAIVGKSGLSSDLGVYGHVGTALARGTGLAGTPGGADGGMTYGVGLSWDFSRRASAILGFDSYDVRGSGGDVRDVRGARLGLQWRY